MEEKEWKKRDFVIQLYVNFSAAKVVQFVQFAIISISILMFINKLWSIFLILWSKMVYFCNFS